MMFQVSSSDHGRENKQHKFMYENKNHWKIREQN